MKVEYVGNDTLDIVKSNGLGEYTYTGIEHGARKYFKLTNGTIDPKYQLVKDEQDQWKGVVIFIRKYKVVSQPRNLKTN